MTVAVKVFKKDGIYIPIKAVKAVKSKLMERNVHRFYEEKACKQCDNRGERHNDICDECPAFKDEYRLAKTVTVKDNKYVRVPIGSWVSTAKWLASKGIETKVKDKAPETEIAPIKFLGKFREGQKEAIKVMMKRKRGLLRAPPRSGKTVSGTALICKLQRKTLILASQRDWLKGFHETFVGSATQPALTDIKKKRIGFCKTVEDFEKYDVCMATIQSFYSKKGEKVLAAIASMFEVIIIDEAHYAAAPKYLAILAKFNSRWMLGLSATPFRKDQKEALIHEVLGKVIHEVEVERLRPHVRVTKTKYKKTYKGNVMWPRMVSGLENDKARLKLIARTALADVEAGHMVLIPFAQTKPVSKLVKMINDLAEENIAHAFTGKEAKFRDELVQKARDYKIKVLVGQLKILSTGINIPRASMLYEVTMSSNLPNAEQRMMRVLTAYEGKPQPCVRFFLDDSNVRRNCMRNEYHNVFVKLLKPVISDKMKVVMDAYFKSRSDTRVEF